MSEENENIENGEVEELNIDDIFSGLNTNVESIKKVSLKSLGLISSPFVSRQTRNNDLFNNETNSNFSLSTKYSNNNEFNFKRPVLFENIYIDGKDEVPKIEAEVRYNDGGWQKINVNKSTKKENCVYIKATRVISSLRIKSLKRVNNTSRVIILSKVRLYGIFLNDLISSIESYKKVKETFDLIKTDSEDLISAYDNLQPEIDGYKSEIGKKQAEITELNTNIDKLKKETSTLESLKTEKEKLDKQKQDLTLEVSNLEKEKTSLQKDIAAYSTNLKDYSKLKNRHARVYVLFSLFLSILLGFIFTTIYPRFDDALIHYTDNPELSYWGLLVLRAFYGIFIGSIIYFLSKALLFSIRSFVKLFAEERDVNALHVLVNDTINSSAFTAGLSEEEVFNINAQSKLKIFNRSRFKEQIEGMEISLKVKSKKDSPEQGLEDSGD